MILRSKSQKMTNAQKFVEDFDLESGELPEVPYAKKPILSIVKQRVTWLVILLLLQSLSSFVLASFSELLTKHLIITMYLTMLVGGGGNASSQSAVQVIKGLATGEISRSTIRSTILRELRIGVLVAFPLVLAAFGRVLVFSGDTVGSAAIAISFFLIVLGAVVCGTLMPLCMHYVLHIDPSHSAAAVQVVMDVVGVCMTCIVCSIMLPDKTTVADATLDY